MAYLHTQINHANIKLKLKSLACYNIAHLGLECFEYIRSKASSRNRAMAASNSWSTCASSIEIRLRIFLSFCGLSSEIKLNQRQLQAFVMWWNGRDAKQNFSIWIYRDTSTPWLNNPFSFPIDTMFFLISIQIPCHPVFLHRSIETTHKEIKLKKLDRHVCEWFAFILRVLNEWRLNETCDIKIDLSIE